MFSGRPRALDGHALQDTPTFRAVVGRPPMALDPNCGAERPKEFIDTSENYLTALPLLLAGRARLLDDKVLREQLASLERRASSSGRESVSHPDAASAHDDLAAAACGALVAAERASRIGIRFGSCGYGGGAITWQPAGSRQGDRDRPRARPLVRVVRLREQETPAVRASKAFRYQ